MIIQHKCPGCGADMIFHPETGLLQCDSCGNTMQIDQEAPSINTPDEQTSYDEFKKTTGNQTYGDDNAAQYQCKNCGAILITTDDTSATTCSFCDAPMILGDRLSGVLAPSKVAPFSITKPQAEEAFRKWFGKGLLRPNKFKKQYRVKSITGMYVPFWLYDLNVNGEVSAECTIVEHRTEGDYDVTETQYFDVYRAGNLRFEKIPVDASEKMDDEMMDKLEPFNYDDLHDFSTPYLAGYLAEKYNYTDKDLYPRIKNRTEDYTTNYFRSTMSRYSTVSIRSKNYNVIPTNADYTLLPVWMFCYDYDNSEHNFYMNGQTGKIVGKPPISKKKCIGFGCLFSVTILIIFKILVYLIGGVWF